MIVTGIKFEKTAKVYYFDGDGLSLKDGDEVLVETSYGKEVATVVFASKEVTEDEIVSPLKKVVRVLDKFDYITLAENKELEEKAFKKCEKKIAEHHLDMKLISCDYTFDRTKLLFYFTADGRIDFRELVRDLAGEFRTRIELRQVGVRDEVKMTSTLGMCGRESCCHAYLTSFHPVSIKMAKTQNLSLNPSKISGVCGRLMCCLKYEEDTYKELNKGLPKVGEKVKIIENGKIAEVAHVNIIREMVKLVIRDDDDVEIVNKKKHEIELLGRKNKQDDGKQNKQNKSDDKQGKSENKSENKKLRRGCTCGGGLCKGTCKSAFDKGGDYRVSMSDDDAVLSDASWREQGQELEQGVNEDVKRDVKREVKRDIKREANKELKPDNKNDLKKDFKNDASSDKPRHKQKKNFNKPKKDYNQKYDNKNARSSQNGNKENANKGFRKNKNNNNNKNNNKNGKKKFKKNFNKDFNKKQSGNANEKKAKSFTNKSRDNAKQDDRA